ncbi:MAG: hypothetical protein ACRDF9_05410 [Candidatus Limnocylindria bacterium]
MRSGGTVIFSRRHVAVAVTMALLLSAFVWLLVANDTEQVAQLEAAADESASGFDAVPVPSASTLRSRWVSQSVPEVIGLGRTATATFAFRNIGSTPWIRGTAAEARLGIVDDDRRFFDLGLALDWPTPNRLAVQTEDVVEVGQVATFSFGLRGSVTGRHHIRVRPVVDGVVWMDDEGVYFDIVVSASMP